MSAELPGRTPVLIGVGQYGERHDDAGYEALPPVDLATRAARTALADTGIDPKVLTPEIDVVAAVRLFEQSYPEAVSPLGRCQNLPRAVARRLGFDPRRAVLAETGGHTPQQLVSEFAGALAAGEARSVLIVGAEAISTVQALLAHQSATSPLPDWHEPVPGPLEDRGHGLDDADRFWLMAHGLRGVPAYYALCENARRSRLGLDPQAYARTMGQLWEPLARLAAAHPLAAVRQARDWQELVTPSERNRLIAEPYPVRLVATEKVNQAAAVLLTTLEVVRRLGIDPARAVYLHGHADLEEKHLLDRPDLGAYPAAGAAVRHALAQTGIGWEELDWADLYSCFPIAVSSVCDALGVDPGGFGVAPVGRDDAAARSVRGPRSLTLLGGLPFFGGPGNGYSLHAVAEVVHRARANPLGYGLIGANGGFMDHYSTGVYSARPTPWLPDAGAAVQDRLDAVPGPARVRSADGWGTVETWTITHHHGRRRGVVVGRLAAGGRRFLARTADGDEAVLALLESPFPAGQRVHVHHGASGNTVRLTVPEERVGEPVAS